MVIRLIEKILMKPSALALIEAVSFYFFSLEKIKDTSG